MDSWVCVEETRAGHPGSNCPHRLDDHPFISFQIEAALDDLPWQKMHLLDSECHAVRLELGTQTRTLPDKPLTPLRGSQRRPGLSRRRGPSSPPMTFPWVSRRSSLTVVSTQQDDARIANLAAEPFVELCPDDGIAIGRSS